MQLSIKREQLFKTIEYPSRYTKDHLHKSVGVMFAALFAFLTLYKPFGVYDPELRFNYILICGLHALSPSLIVFVYFTILNYYRSNSVSPKWTLFRECAQLSILFLLIGIASFLMRGFIYDNPGNWSLRYFWEEVRNCYLVGSLFYLGLLYANFYHKNKKGTPHIGITANPTEDSLSDISADKEVFIQTKVKQDNFSLNPDDLLFVKAEGNYVQLTLCKDGRITNDLKRISLRQLELQLSGYPVLFRCHRAYLVNLAKIERVSGNSQGYLVSFQSCADKIPVSRALIESFNNQFSRNYGVSARNLVGRHKA